MDSHSLKFLKDMADAAAPARRVFTSDREPPHVYWVQQADGKLERVSAKPFPTAHAAADLDTLVRVVRDQTDPADVPEVWYSRAGVIAVLNPAAEHPARCTVDLTPSPQLALLAQWERAGKATLTQAELVILLRTLFAGCAPDDVLAAVRGLKVDKRTEVNQQIAQGKVSLGRSLVAEMTGAAALPERITFSVPVFAEAAVGVCSTVRVELDPDPQNERFHLYVLPGDIESAYADAEEALALRLARLLGESPVPVYRGRP